jgi:hypothetical protein
MSKGSKRRPSAIDRGDFDRKWRDIFGSPVKFDPKLRPSPNMDGGPDCQCPGCIQRRALSD